MKIALALKLEIEEQRSVKLNLHVNSFKQKKSSNVRNSSGNIIIVKLNLTQNKKKKMKQILVFLYMCNIKYIYSNKPTVRQRDRLISTCIRTFVNMQTIILFSISSVALVALIAFESDSVSKSS